MTVKTLIPTVLTDRVTETRDFYLRHFDVELTWDSSEFVGLRAKEPEATFEIAFRKPSEHEKTVAGGVSYAMVVDDVDAEHARLTKAGLPVLRPLQDNPWGDRSFVVQDPAGVALYICHPIEVAPELQKYVRS